MKTFTSTEPTQIKFVHPVTGVLVIMEPGDSIGLPDETVTEFVENRGWGTSDNMSSSERQPGAAATLISVASDVDVDVEL